MRGATESRERCPPRHENYTAVEGRDGLERPTAGSTREESIMGQLEITLREVAQARKELEGTQAEIAEMRARLDATRDGMMIRALGNNAKLQKALVGLAEGRARAQTVVAFRLTSDKRPAPGASIRMTKLVDICGDMADVKAWAITSAPHVLQVHAPTLRKQILAGGVPETLAVIKEEPRGALAKDLSSWLTETREAAEQEEANREAAKQEGMREDDAEAEAEKGP